MSIDEFLRSTLRDFRLSRGEKRILGRVVDELGATEHDLAVYRSRAFEMAREELIDPTAPRVLDWLEEVVKALRPDEDPSRPVRSTAFFSPHDECHEEVARLIRATQRTLDICVFTITDDRISREIEAAHRRRVKVRVISDDDKSQDLGSDIQRLDRAGLSVAVDRTRHHMHHKYAIFDGGRLLTGSYNWTRSAAEHNEENFIVTDDSNLLSRFSQEFEKLWSSLT